MLISNSKLKKKNKNNNKKVTNESNYLKIGIQANWDEKYLTQVGYFAHANAGWNVSQLGKTSHPDKMTHLI